MTLSGSVGVPMGRPARSCDHQQAMAHPALEELRRLRPAPGLARSTDDRVVAGVAGGLGHHLGIDPTVVRLCFGVLTLANGVGALLYLVGWTFLPAASGPPADVPEPSGDRALGLALVTVGALLLFGQAGLLLPAPFVWSATLAAVGFGLVWTGTDERDRTRVVLLRAAGGGLLLVVGLALLLTAGGALTTLGQLGLAALATGVGVALLLGPWILRLWRDLAVERRERIRSEERSEMAAHLHDSVLQTLALIQRTEAPGRARTLARRQERELRAWLFDERAPDAAGAATDLTGALERVVTDVEDAHDVEVDLVVVGECPTEPRVDALVAAVREAAHNAARHAGVDEVSVYVEVEADRLTAYVRDRGVGFDLGAIEAGRMGVRESIIARMARHGGSAEVHSAPGEGTEVVLSVGRTPAAEVEP
jgi:signal transduction histidine kinase/phage shock protein PspC (stress-responsive transcriptional regulator)